MNLIIKLIVIFFILSITGNLVNAQFNVSLNTGTSFPVRDFGSDDLENNEDAGGANIGWDINLKIVYTFLESGLGVYSSIGYLHNGLTKKAKESYEKVLQEVGVSFKEIEYYKYNCFPLSAGLNFMYKLNKSITFIGNAGIIYNNLQVTRMLIRAYSTAVTFEFDKANSVGNKMGCGIKINDRISFELNYLDLGKHKVHTTLNGAGITIEEDLDLTIDMLSLTIGVHF